MTSGVRADVVIELTPGALDRLSKTLRSPLALAARGAFEGDTSVANEKSFRSRTAWLRFVMKTLAVRGMTSGASKARYAICLSDVRRVLNTGLEPRLDWT